MNLGEALSQARVNNRALTSNCEVATDLRRAYLRLEFRAYSYLYVLQECNQDHALVLATRFDARYIFNNLLNFYTWVLHPVNLLPLKLKDLLGSFRKISIRHKC